jgi:hypothetical protein
MDVQSIEQLIGEYRSCADAHNEPGDGSDSWVERVNHAADRMIVIARRVAEGGPEAVSRFGSLLQTDRPHVSLWAAHHLLDFMNPDPGAREAALALIERTATGEGVLASGEKHWLDNWVAEQQDE